MRYPLSPTLSPFGREGVSIKDGPISCMHGYAPTEGCGGLFTIDASHLTFGVTLVPRGGAWSG